MVLILIYWCILFFFASLSGIAFQNCFGFTKKNTAFTLLYGVIYQTLFLSLCAFFYAINFEIFILNSLIQFLFLYLYSKEFIEFLTSISKLFSKRNLCIFALFCSLTALKSAQLSTLFDNESYYIQTIKWLNEYGFVKGVANVHPFLGQFSFWHVMQSGFNFSFLAVNFNDLNGFILIIGMYYFMEKNIQKKVNWSFFGIIFIVFYYQFIDAPSPDLLILVISSMVFYEYIENTTDFKSMVLFVIFMIFIKLTIAPLLLIALVYACKNKNCIFYFIGISVVFGTVWISKNIIITGYPLFPLTLFPTSFDWKMSETVLNKLAQQTIEAGYSENLIKTLNLSLIDKLKMWFALDGINFIFNRGILLLFILMPFTKVFKSNFNFKILYAILVIHFSALLVTSPQYRFFLPTFILFSTLILSELSAYFKYNTKNNMALLSLSLIVFCLFFDLKTGFQQTGFNLKQIIIPNSISLKNNTTFKKKQIDNFSFFDPELKNLYQTADGNLPCVNEKLFYFYNYIPQQRTNYIKDGFYAKEVQK